MIDTLPADGLARVRAWLAEYQQRLIDCFEGFEPTEKFCDDVWERPEGGGGRTRVLSGGEVFEQVGVGFSDVCGATLPVAATARRPELVGAAWRAVGCSVVVHPRNPHVPTSHANVRLIVTTPADGAPIWWFGGGFDLTPFYPVHADIFDWHRRAQALCKPFADDRYAAHKAWCDKYFYLPHRGETRGVGGLFFDDLNADGFERSFAYLQAVGDGYLSGYTALVERRAGEAYGDRERDFQLYRRGRYVEFNLVHDRGTLFGLQSGGRTESILMSLPPAVRFAYGFCPAPGSAEARLADYLRPRDWLAEPEGDAGAPVMARP